MSQTVYLDTGGYNISFLAAQRGNYQSAAQQIEVLVDGSVVGTATPGYTNYNIYQTMNFQATAGPHTIEFLGLNSAGGDVTAFIDDIVLGPAEDGITQNSAQLPENDAITDGGFEVPAQPTNGMQIDPEGTPWTYSGIAGVSYNNSAFTTITTGGNNVIPNGLQNVAPSGLQVGFIKNDASISQAVYLDAGLYNVTLEAAQRFNYQSQPQQIEVLVDGVPVSVITPVATYIPATNTDGGHDRSGHGLLCAVPVGQFPGDGRSAHDRTAGSRADHRRQHGLRRRGRGEQCQRRQRRQLRDARAAHGQLCVRTGRHALAILRRGRHRHELQPPSRPTQAT